MRLLDGLRSGDILVAPPPPVGHAIEVAFHCDPNQQYHGGPCARDSGWGDGPGSGYRWSGGECGKYTPGGSFILWVDRDFCRRSQGSNIRWSGGDCGEYSPAGNLVQWVNRDSCRHAHGSYFRWSGGDCGEYTPGGSWIQWVSRGYCR